MLHLRVRSHTAFLVGHSPFIVPCCDSVQGLRATIMPCPTSHFGGGVHESISARLANMVLPEAGGGEVRLGSLWEQGPQSSSFYATTGESSAANMSRSCASTKVSLSNAEPPWPQLDSVTSATLACFGKRLASPCRYL